MTDWKLVADELQKNMQDKQPEIKVRDVMRWFNLSSTSSAVYYLHKMQEMGYVKWVGNGNNGKWFLAW